MFYIIVVVIIIIMFIIMSTPIIQARRAGDTAGPQRDTSTPRG